MRCYCAGVLALVWVPGLAAPQEGGAKQDLERIQGVWNYVALESDGKPASAEQLKKMIPVTFKGDQWIQVRDNKGAKLTVKLDPSKKPRAIDLTWLDGKDKGKTVLGVYSLEGDTLKINANWKGGARPTGFKSEGGASLIVLARDKK
jgi:uncharacterized protein (TIGR03067 family)